MTAPSVPSTHAHLLEQPLFAHLVTVRPDGAPQSSVMWFAWDGDLLRFTHTTTRRGASDQARARDRGSRRTGDRNRRLVTVP